nr:arf-GAP with GTPase, ANK repeat and PH domain-containing protein 3-like [Pelodiscus sinensis]|eukprot:XP_014426078.1 arf-GAP with GTPase, ANK repeat and PH domain-containing protein 3-like [Pelodiscus sinensis]
MLARERAHSCTFVLQGIVGNLSSGKSALVHRYLTGTYVQEESPEGGRFKKEIVVDGQSYLLLIRDEGGPPELQVRAPVSVRTVPLGNAISATNPRVIDDSRARKLSNDLKRCTYYETCATYGLNVERVFQDGNCSPVRSGPLPLQLPHTQGLAPLSAPRIPESSTTLGPGNCPMT